MRRKLSLLGGTTRPADCLAAAALLARPRTLVEGPAIARYERAFAAAAGTPHALSFASGRAGLYAILRALGIGAGDEVLLQVPTHIVVPNAIRRAGATPVYADCRPGDWNIDLDDAQRRISPRTRALVLQHTFGIPADMDAVERFAEGHGLIVVEDCVHALGATWRGRPLGSFGRAAFFSTEETKVISTTMGGMVVTSDEALAGRIADVRAAWAPPPRGLTVRYLLKFIAYFLLTEPRVHRYARAAYERAGNAQPLPRPTSEEELAGGWSEDLERPLSNAQAELGLRQLQGLEANLAHRRRIAAQYARLLAERGFPPPSVPAEASPAWVRYPLLVDDRAAAVARTHPHVVLGTWFTSVLEEALSPAAGGYAEGSCPEAERAARALVNLPTHGRVRDGDVRRLVDAIAGPS